MPSAPLRGCAFPGCPELVPRGYCAQHRAPVTPRPTAAQRGYNGRWQKARATFLSRPENALCVECKGNKRIVAASVVDHIIPHKGDQAKFWAQNNWQPLCITCHNAKTATENGRQS